MCQVSRIDRQRASASVIGRILEGEYHRVVLDSGASATVFEADTYLGDVIVSTKPGEKLVDIKARILEQILSKSAATPIATWRNVAVTPK
jgi:hypothetical protein